MTYLAQYHSPLGDITMCGDDEALTGLWFVGQKHFGATLPNEAEEGRCVVLDQTARWLDQYFEGRNPGVTPLVRFAGTSFQNGVWRLLTEVPYGKTVTYKDIACEMARRMGRRTMSAQAVGAAVARNPVSIIVPCHRVLGSDGRLTGYAGGLETKSRLLRLETLSLF